MHFDCAYNAFDSLGRFGLVGVGVIYCLGVVTFPGRFGSRSLLRVFERQLISFFGGFDPFVMESVVEESLDHLLEQWLFIIVKQFLHEKV